MSIAIEDRIRRALAIAAARGPVLVSDRVRALAEVRERDAEGASAIAVVLADTVDARGHARGDTLPRRLPCVAVLEDDGRLEASLTQPQLDGVFAVVCRRGVIECTQSGFVLVEVEDGISARETQAEYGVAMLADARLCAFE